MNSTLDMFTFVMEDMEIERESKRRKSTSNDEHHHPGPGNCFENLPQEVALDIISRLYIKSVIQFRFRYRNFPGSEVQIFCQGSEKWRVIGDIPYKLDQSSGGVFVNGKLHWVSLWGKNHCRRDRILVSFDLSNEIFSEVPLPENDVNLFRHRYSLSVLGGCLSIVHPSSTNYWVQDIWIMKEYGVKESWERVFSIGAYDVTRYRSPEMRRTYRIWKNVINQRYVHVLCLLSNGEILLQYRWGALVSYNPENGMFKDIKFPGMPKFFHITVHIGSLSRANAASMLMNLN
ncbi:F-box protein At3g07870-like isoform X1 [Coffea arabica]|uniref:F-box protein At3g07870-like isoform X1 n=1 Tax=Coffea arabica TaxID=13443 RepID=A0ABM4WB13_COFAR